MCFFRYCIYCFKYWVSFLSCVIAPAHARKTEGPNDVSPIQKSPVIAVPAAPDVVIDDAADAAYNAALHAGTQQSFFNRPLTADERALMAEMFPNRAVPVGQAATVPSEPSHHAS